MQTGGIVVAKKGVAFSVPRLSMPVPTFVGVTVGFAVTVGTTSTHTHTKDVNVMILCSLCAKRSRLCANLRLCDSQSRRDHNSCVRG